MQTLFGSKLTRRDVMRAAWRIRREDRLQIGPALRRAWAWVRRKARPVTTAPADRYAAMRARGVFSPIDPSPAAAAHFAGRRPGGRGCGSWSTGR